MVDRTLKIFGLAFVFSFGFFHLSAFGDCNYFGACETARQAYCSTLSWNGCPINQRSTQSPNNLEDCLLQVIGNNPSGQRLRIYPGCYALINESIERKLQGHLNGPNRPNSQPRINQIELRRQIQISKPN